MPRPALHQLFGRGGVAELSAVRVAANLAAVRDEIRSAGRDPDELEILAAVKYLDAEQLDALADGGITLLGENRAQDLVAKAERGSPGTSSVSCRAARSSRSCPTCG